MVPRRHLVANGCWRGAGGSPVRIAYEAYLYDSGECYWDAEPVLQTLLAGRGCVRAWVVELQKERVRWQDLRIFLGLPWAAAHQPSRRQCQHDAALAVGAPTRGP